MNNRSCTFVGEIDSEKIIRTLIELFCRQEGYIIIDLKISNIDDEDLVLDTHR